MIISQLLFNTTKIKLIQFSNIYKYDSKYQDIYNII